MNVSKHIHSIGIWYVYCQTNPERISVRDYFMINLLLSRRRRWKIAARLLWSPPSFRFLFIHSGFFFSIFSLIRMILIYLSTPLFADPRTKSWPLSGSPTKLLLILGTYLYFCINFGPKYMKDRKPFELKKTLIIYNIVQVILSVVLVVEVSNSHNYAPIKRYLNGQINCFRVVDLLSFINLSIGLLPYVSLTVYALGQCIYNNLQFAHWPFLHGPVVGRSAKCCFLYILEKPFHIDTVQACMA